MKRINMVLVLIAILFVALCMELGVAESLSEYVSSEGWTYADISEYSGDARCYLLEMADTQSLSFSEGNKLYTVIGVRMLDTNYDETKMRQLFLDLLCKQDWTICYYWPDYDSVGSLIQASYGITDDLSLTKNNFEDYEGFITELEQLFNLKAAANSDRNKMYALDGHLYHLYEYAGELTGWPLVKVDTDPREIESMWDYYQILIFDQPFFLEVGFGDGPLYRFWLLNQAEKNDEGESIGPSWETRFGVIGQIMNYMQNNEQTTIEDINSYAEANDLVPPSYKVMIAISGVDENTAGYYIEYDLISQEYSITTTK